MSRPVQLETPPPVVEKLSRLDQLLPVWIAVNPFKPWSEAN